MSKPQSLIGFLRALGGIKDNGGDLRSMGLHRRFPGLVNNKAGMPLDRAREVAAEAGYLGADTENAMRETIIQDLLDAIDAHPRYSVHDERQAAEFGQHEQWKEWRGRVDDARKEIESNLVSLGEKPEIDQSGVHGLGRADYDRRRSRLGDRSGARGDPDGRPAAEGRRPWI